MEPVVLVQGILKGLTFNLEKALKTSSCLRSNATLER